MQRYLIKWLYPKAEKIIVNSRENKYDLAKFLNISEDKIEVRYNPIDKEKIKKLSKENLDDEILGKIKNKKVFITT
jgi:N-acetylgalactosamine-N,N'-diacetylbacillosaminyl-diphospho-undecaprenol 4-alpha-N-acetylgalactosaminyltransferase